VTGVLIQLIPFGRQHTNPPVVREPAWDSPQTRALAKRACFNCHSNETTWPWYSSVAPVSWLTQRDVNGGRSHLNFSEWNKVQRHAGHAAEEISREICRLGSICRCIRRRNSRLPKRRRSPRDSARCLALKTRVKTKTTTSRSRPQVKGCGRRFSRGMDTHTSDVVAMPVNIRFSKNSRPEPFGRDGAESAVALEHATTPPICIPAHCGRGFRGSQLQAIENTPN